MALFPVTSDLRRHRAVIFAIARLSCISILHKLLQKPFVLMRYFRYFVTLESNRIFDQVTVVNNSHEN